MGGLNLYAFVLNDPLNYVDPHGLSAWWEWLPIVATCGHLIQDVVGDDISEYTDYSPSGQDCCEDQQLAIDECIKKTNQEFRTYLGDYLGVTIGPDALKATAALVADSLAVWAIKNGARGAVGGAISGGILTADAIIDTAIVVNKANEIRQAANAATEANCKCDDE